MIAARNKTGRRVVFALAFLAAFTSMSCGRETHGLPVYPVRGQAFYMGKPITSALVLFHPTNDPDPQSPRPHGQVDQDGVFTLTTYQSSDGAPVGEYVVTVDLRKTIPGRGGVAESLIPRKYGNPKESPLRATVTKENNELLAFQISE